MKRPLYTVSCDELSPFGQATERKFSTALSLAAKWKAVVLIDEADVFMAERNKSELAKSENVSGETFPFRIRHETNVTSVLLRTLEYFEGIIFLTTNRVEVIDPAFRSRIHLSIAYPPLSVGSRCELWKTFVIQGSAQRHPRWLNEKFLSSVSGLEINGREIKNAVRVAHAIAVNDKRGMAPKDIHSVLRALTPFENEFRDWSTKRGPEAEKAGTSSKRRKESSFID